jgi:hypothetical protein
VTHGIESDSYDLEIVASECSFVVGRRWGYPAGVAVVAGADVERVDLSAASIGGASSVPISSVGYWHRMPSKKDKREPLIYTGPRHD